ncbi:MAG: hypothetical protein ACKO6N_24380 [Myxococcota bacterium]
MADRSTAPASADWTATLALSLLSFVATLWVQRGILFNFPTSADEYAYLWQARAFSQGQLLSEAPHPLETFAFFHLGELNGLRYSRFPVGWPLLLTPLTWLGVEWLTNPLLGACAVAGIHRLGIRWVGLAAATWGVLLVLLSPFFLLNVASYHSHPASLFSGVCLALSLVRAQASSAHAARWGIVSGLSFGLAVLMRPFTALLMGVPLMLFLTRGFSRRWWSAFFLGGLPTLLIFLEVNRAITGHWLTLPTVLYDPQEGLGFGVHGHSVQQGLQNTLLWSLEGLGFTFFMTPVLIFFARGRAGAHEKLLWSLLLAPVIGYFFYWNPGGFRYGPRFWFEALFPFALLVGVGLEQLRTRPLWRRLLPLFALLGLLGLSKMLLDERQRMSDRRILQVKLEQEPLSDAIILLLNSHGDLPVYDLTRNPPDFRAQPVLFGMGRGAADAEVAAAWPDRTLYYYRWSPEGGTLWPYHPLQVEIPDPLPDK